VLLILEVNQRQHTGNFQLVMALVLDIRNAELIQLLYLYQDGME